MIFKPFKNPVTHKRFLLFKEVKRAYISFWILILLYVISLFSEFICSDIPLYVKFNGQSYFPALKFYPEDQFIGNKKNTRPDYKSINQQPVFSENPDNFMLFPPFAHGPYASIDPSSIAVSNNVTVILTPLSLIGTVNIKNNYLIAKSVSCGFFLGKSDNEVKGLALTESINLPKPLKQAVRLRFENQKAKRVSYTIKTPDNRKAIVSLSTFLPRKKPPETVRLTFREVDSKPDSKKDKIIFDENLITVDKDTNLWDRLADNDQKKLLELVQKRFLYPLDPIRLKLDNRLYTAAFIKKDVRFPFAPVSGHPMGIDGAGRDVMARVLYGLRTSLTFSILLVICSMTVGVITGSVQGYYGGISDILGQRIIEIWSALPFLYVMILMGSVYGRSFVLLLFCYGIFNWIGISYYIRAEFLRLRKQPFVEAAKCMGLSSGRIMFKHVLPNAMAPVITFFPFSLVGAIGSLAALDYLGFGLPPPTPSWGELLFQAQQYRWAWWLILYPSLALFLVMLCGVFVGEGIRNAFDPKRYTRME